MVAQGFLGCSQIIVNRLLFHFRCYRKQKLEKRKRQNRNYKWKERRDENGKPTGTSDAGRESKSSRDVEGATASLTFDDDGRDRGLGLNDFDLRG